MSNDCLIFRMRVSHRDLIYRLPWRPIVVLIFAAGLIVVAAALDDSTQANEAEGIVSMQDAQLADDLAKPLTGNDIAEFMLRQPDALARASFDFERTAERFKAIGDEPLVHARARGAYAPDDLR